MKASTTKTSTVKTTNMKSNKKAPKQVRSNVNKGVTKKAEKKAGVIQSLIDTLKGTMKTKEMLLQELVKLFPEREESALKSTINAQLSGSIARIEKERGLRMKRTTKVVDNEEFVYYRIVGKADWSIMQGENESEE